jgi:hypothetical protein
VSQPLKIWHEADGLPRLRLDWPKANLVDAAMIAALDQALRSISVTANRWRRCSMPGATFQFRRQR